MGSKVNVSKDKKTTKCGIFFEAVLAGAVLGALRLRAVYVWENIFSIVGVTGVAVGHATTSVTK